MTKHLSFLTMLMIFNVVLFAQQQPNNPGFESWEDVGVGTDEPTHWNSIKTGDNPSLNQVAPVVWGKSTDAHSGQYSLKLFDVSVFGIVATGTITNGQTHANFNPDSGFVFTNVNDDRFHTSFNLRPDSLTGWYKSAPTEDDFGTIKFVLHKDYLQLPGDETNIIATAYFELPQGEVATWTRFSVPFVYVSEETPDYFLSVITSGNGVNALEGSTAWFDDFSFVYKANNINEITLHQLQTYQKDNALHIQLDNLPAQTYQLKLVDLNGQVILHRAARSGDHVKINTIGLVPGLYVVVAQHNNQTSTRKIILY
ncbi:MAG: T9SS type A sorting domain-containing protein [Bacteroidales bacterium]